ncbi:ParA family protein [Corynebacterium alimapuense]|uniref:Chromosome partitioning protein ParA n=1 Tax=Corynebacterium alimapuense TaxID=1576874 RepID=A0A3M8K5M3_9CORY|nr:ParA family protein [Corynebacterium alimapuense]RNE48055.1 chromosome partitioning protein ParA [Corynebacterium alimapuense]
MPVLTIAHTKGGVGKTTSAVLLCAAAWKRGIDVVLIDADAQGTATAWSRAADDVGDGFPWLMVTAATPAALLRALNEHSGLVIVDTPPGGYEVIEAAINAGDLIMIPSSASPLDVNRVWPTVEATTHRPAVVCLTQVDSRTTLPKLARSTLEKEGIVVADSEVPAREALRHMYATTPQRLYGYDELLTELLSSNLLGEY